MLVKKKTDSGELASQQAVLFSICAGQRGRGGKYKSVKTVVSGHQGKYTAVAGFAPVGHLSTSRGAFTLRGNVGWGIQADSSLCVQTVLAAGPG